MKINIFISMPISVLFSHLLAMDLPANGHIQILDGVTSVQVVDATGKSPTPPPPCAHCKKYGHTSDECWPKSRQPANGQLDALD
ncbi:hypothetical protein PGT21_035302 [Puccinia graminis f. sp. tritici]|uniref:CCHC-type domain-containing protein n=1 Tax=Puccinia graminis f. sp. tritici TaxID=56615 RepID=A0A5B0QCN8_PUCGR|nr:hypothetical protein PGT21_035302 [Puccinia graminis f. sp. tritici]